ncbi:MAG: carboxynorspermidine decarboxylase [Gammaproteobacteria bacterium]|nr:carboxynorspermidine decarboxylase [Gammaproteobacteria bacterium]NIN60949.1 carboxynorspermidine decarboxylase [Gammaproteobacteria bacterium]NIO62573.1 carboxynorspermidine decarboxylase [Gammaproteobacteria bacterium]NIP49510.1 carboxynorspermidine decarboxylase [Gammaproteobacteria bacterium]NIQ10734.1 carboxynorspermidine decarboxylase [Gammaproteobacteria bacterium]
MTVSQQFNEHLLGLWSDASLTTPAFVYDERAINDKLDMLTELRRETGCKILYSVKALSFSALLKQVAKRVDGFSVSSAFEARLAAEILKDSTRIHLTSPGIRPADGKVIADHCGYVSFNSLSQWQQFAPVFKKLSFGLRVNPGVSYALDVRFDPCRPASKLGVALAAITDSDQLPAQLHGLHIHNNCESRDLEQLVVSVEKLMGTNPLLLQRLNWINFGGGYLFERYSDLDPLVGLSRTLKEKYKLDLFFEPGKGIVGSAGYVVASVIDMFRADDKTIAVLDTSVNHLPEIFEYQYRPMLLQESTQGKHGYRLAGASCLSGDLFGDYFFDHELKIGSRIVIANVGAYMLVKASMFNGINLPAVYSLDASGRLHPRKVYDYSHYRERL